MKKAPIPKNEKGRIKALEEYSILNSLPEQDYDNITKIASQICQTQISLVNLIGSTKEYVKSNYGIEKKGGPREYSFCAHAINEPSELFIIPDTRKDERFVDNPTVISDPGIVFYAGVSLVNPQGYALGTLCVIDRAPKILSEEQIDSLKALAKQVVNL
ncbi:GAF domain-containing protein, partial [Xanthovirga aplysinae]|uniref:GAF domain-containing protein n=1 Tax=Xanthovirga aplysinae TaxID=2529853 RepID=UPI0012BB7440